MERRDVLQVAAEQPVKVASRDQGEETMMIGRDRWEEMHRLKSQGMSVSDIARITEADRKTVRACLRREVWQPYRRAPVTRTLLEGHMPWLEQRAPQVGYSARILFQELCRDHGFTGAYETVRNAVRPLRTDAATASLTQLRFETGPGEQAQVDWGQVRVRFDTTPATVHIFVMTLGYSRRAWVEGFVNERLSHLLAAHEHAFEHFGGPCAELLYDRMRTVVLGSAEGRPRWNPTFDAFARYWGFSPRICRPYRAKTKGKVESGVKYVKRNFLPGRSFRDLEDFNEQLRQWNTLIADVRIHGTTHQRPIDRFAAEAGVLATATRAMSFVQAMVRERVVAEDWLITVDANRYSVPYRLIGKTVQVVRNADRWRITYRSELVADHPVLCGRHQLSVLPEHGPGAGGRNARRRFPDAAAGQEGVVIPEVEIRDLAVYEQTLEVA
jgi:transposase